MWLEKTALFKLAVWKASRVTAIPPVFPLFWHLRLNSMFLRMMSPLLNNIEHHSHRDYFTCLNLNQKSSDQVQTVQSSAARFLKRRNRFKDLTNYFQGASWTFSVRYLWPLSAALRALLLWDPLTNILSVPTAWLKTKGERVFAVRAPRLSICLTKSSRMI